MYFYKPSKVNVKNKKNEADYGEFSPKKFRSLNCLYIGNINFLILFLCHFRVT